MATLHGERRNRSPAKYWRPRREVPPSVVGKSVMADWLLSIACCIGVAALLPSGIGTAVLAALLSVSGYLWLAVAILRDGPPASAPYPTAWDAALLSFAASFAVQAALRLGILGG